jgi:hypothetical protein
MVINPAMLVVDDQQHGRLPQIGILFDRVVDGCDEQLTCLHVMVWVLVGGDFSAAVGVVIAIVRLNEAIVGDLAFLAVTQKLLVSAK